jgi:hypothetical protein
LRSSNGTAIRYCLTMPVPGRLISTLIALDSLLAA